MIFAENVANLSTSSSSFKWTISVNSVGALICKKKSLFVSVSAKTSELMLCFLKAEISFELCLSNLAEIFEKTDVYLFREFTSLNPKTATDTIKRREVRIPLPKIINRLFWKMDILFDSGFGIELEV